MATRYDTHHVATVSSTQDLAREVFSGVPVLVTADRQTAGRGRSGRSWEQADRAVFASLAWRPTWPAETWPRLALVAGLAARDALDGAVDLKWPNDLLIEGRKVGGLLAESSGGLAVVGAGINLWWPEPPEGMAGVHGTDPGRPAAAAVAATWATRLLERHAKGPEAWGREEYRSACATIGSRISWEPEGRGLAADVAPDGSLVVDTEEGQVVLSSGEVRHIRAASLDPSSPEVEQ